MSKINPDQLKLFMGGQEWQDTATESIDRRGTETMSDVWKAKDSEARRTPQQTDMLEVRAPNNIHNVVGQIEYTTPHGSGMYDKIKTDGYQHNEHDPPAMRPMGGGQFQQLEGHHRVASAAAVERDTGRNVWLPTTYESSW